MSGVDAWDTPQLLAGAELKAAKNEQDRQADDDDTELSASDEASFGSLIQTGADGLKKTFGR